MIPRGGIKLRHGSFDQKNSDNTLNKEVFNFTTTAAASKWFSRAIGIAIGFNFYVVAIVSIAFAVIVPLLPKVGKRCDEVDKYGGHKC
jgi:putative Mg2+ transporter-C (MgtC) family protein